MGWPKKLKPSRQTWKWMPGLFPIPADLVREIVEGRQLGRSLPTWVGKETWEEDGTWVPCCEVGTGLPL